MAHRVPERRGPCADAALCASFKALTDCQWMAKSSLDFPATKFVSIFRRVDASGSSPGCLRWRRVTPACSGSGPNQHVMTVGHFVTFRGSCSCRWSVWNRDWRLDNLEGVPRNVFAHIEDRRRD